MTRLLPAKFVFQLALAFVAGAIGVLAFAPFYFWPVALVSMLLLFALWHRAATSWRAIAIGFVWGLGLFIFGVPWIYVSLHDFGGMPAMIAAGFTFLFCCYLSIFPALAGALHRQLASRCGISAVASLLLVMPACFVMFEYVRGWFFSGFPWLVFGYSQTPGGLIAPLMGYAPIVGVFGISWILAVTAGSCVLLVRGMSGVVWSQRGRVMAVVAIFIVFGIGSALHHVSWSAPAGAPLSVALMQGNIEQSLKWRDDQREVTLGNYRHLVEASKARLIVLPETALPMSLHDVPADYLALLKRRSEANGGDMIVGVTIVERTSTNVDGYAVANSAVSLGSSPMQRYDKQHLVVFGEFIPPYLSWVYQWLQIPLGSMTAGRHDQKPLRVAGHAIAVNICYEDAFGAEVARQLPEAELLVNMSNMAWFGHSFAADQQAQFSQMRALEMGRWILRSTNTGVTAAINDKGEIVKALPQFARGTLELEVQPRTGTTPYVIWKDWLILGLLMLALGLGSMIKSIDRHLARRSGRK